MWIIKPEYIKAWMIFGSIFGIAIALLAIYVAIMTNYTIDKTRKIMREQNERKD